MSRWQILSELFGIILKYGPQAAQIIAKAETFIVAGDWPGLAAYLLSLLPTAPPTVTAADIATMQQHLDNLAA